ncbi:major facilitator superfamily domain-containing protein [Hysterangium stoloniferum]|nr:major facilitator superfamily domain-containing protein [Hysterangium stoloniferum]
MNIDKEQDIGNSIHETYIPRADIVEKICIDDILVPDTPSSEPDPLDIPPDGGLTAWLVVLACFLFNVNFLGILYAFGVYQAHYLLHQFPDSSPELISLIGTTYTTLMIVFGFPASKFMNMYGFRPVSGVGSILFSGGLVAAGFCRTVPTLLVTQGVVVGFGAGVLFIPATIGELLQNSRRNVLSEIHIPTAPVQWFSKRRSLSIGISSAGAGIGGIFWSFLTRAIIARLGYQWALWLSGAISAGINVLALFMLKTRPSRSSPMKTSFWRGLTACKSAKFVTLYLANVLGSFGFLVPFFYVPTYAQTQLKASPFVGSMLSAILDIGIVFGRVFLGIAADSRLGALNSIISAMILAGICQFLLWLPAAESLPLLYIFSFTYGFFGGGMMPVILARICDPDQLTSIAGVFYTSEIPGQLVGGPIAGAIFSHAHGDWTPVITYSGMTLFCASLLAVATRLQVERRIFVTI